MEILFLVKLAGGFQTKFTVTLQRFYLCLFFFLRKLRQTKEEGREDNTPEVGDSAWVRWRDNGAELAALGLDGLISALSHLTGSTEDRDHLS